MVPVLEGADNVGQTFSGAWSTIKNSIVNGFANELTPVIDWLPHDAWPADKVEAGFGPARHHLPGPWAFSSWWNAPALTVSATP